MINQTWLHTFCTLTEVGHFTQTADKLFMTQSGVSQHVKKLEQHLATELLIREGKSFTLTHAGKQLYQQGKVLLQSMQALEQSIKNDDQFCGEIRIKSPGSIGLKLYPYLLDIQAKHPKLTMHYTIAPNADIENSLLSHDCDLGLMTEQSRQEKITRHQIANEALVLVTAANVEHVSWPVLNELGFIGHPDGAHHAQLLLSKNYPEFEHISQITKHGFSNQIGAILEPVSRGLGFTVLPAHAANAFSSQQKINIHSLTHSISEPVYLCKNRNGQASQRVKYIERSIKAFLNSV
ncbi:LysR family transcriptional regulator [Thalassotalea sp. PLHSN55]|uniref:LysR family transcriptional regulator n=1 Tax=Thalassotalea sp. PLHSN55 TaxID=3435888 RepID=UPI003F87CF17